MRFGHCRSRARPKSPERCLEWRRDAAATTRPTRGSIWTVAAIAAPKEVQRGDVPKTDARTSNPQDLRNPEKYPQPVELLPEEPSAQGLRVGRANEGAMACPTEYVAVATGHSLKNASALFEYIRAKPAALQPMAVQASGYEPFAWGTCGEGPKAAILEPYLRTEGKSRRLLGGRVDAAAAT